MDTTAIANEVYAKASQAAKDFADRHFDGRDGGACGFAWVTVYPANKGNTKLGKAERALLSRLGFRPGHDKGYVLWDPAKWPGQSIDCKEAGAVVAASVLDSYGFRAYAGSRLD